MCYAVALLPLARSHPGPPLRHGHRHVELRVRNPLSPMPMSGNVLRCVRYCATCVRYCAAPMPCPVLLCAVFGTVLRQPTSLCHAAQYRGLRGTDNVCGANRCILAELYTGYPIFPGENEVEQLACIMEIQVCPRPAYAHAATCLRTCYDVSAICRRACYGVPAISYARAMCCPVSPWPGPILTCAVWYKQGLPPRAMVEQVLSPLVCYGCTMRYTCNDKHGYKTCTDNVERTGPIVLESGTPVLITGVAGLGLAEEDVFRLQRRAANRRELEGQEAKARQQGHRRRCPLQRRCFRQLP